MTNRHPADEDGARVLALEVPAWVAHACDASGCACSAVARMQFVIGLASRALEDGSGGPFGAAVFDGDGRAVSAGINCVIRSACSIWHAEMVAIALAQRRLGRYDLSDGGRLSFELVSSSEPCAMCYGAIPWAGLSRLTCGARASDAEAIGFDEGPKPADWVRHLDDRGIQVCRDVLRERAVDVLHRYRLSGGVIY